MWNSGKMQTRYCKKNRNRASQNIFYRQKQLEFLFISWQSCFDSRLSSLSFLLVKQIILAAPRGPCAGVNRALEIVEQALQKYGAPIYVNHELVHNRYVVEDLTRQGVIFSREPESIPAGSIYLFSAHGVSPTFRARVKNCDLHLIDATCPLVTKVHDEAKKFAVHDSYIFFIGHRGHPEVEGTMGVTKMHLVESVADVAKIDLKDISAENIFVLTQTTLSVDETTDIIAALKHKFPQIKTPPAKDICYATTNRQKAIKELAQLCDLILVVGSRNSSNSNRLVEAAERSGAKAILIEKLADVPESYFTNVKTLGVSSGASVPEVLVQQLISELQKMFSDIEIQNLEILKEKVIFALPTI